MRKNRITSYLKPFVIIVIMMFSLNANAQKERLQTAFVYQLTRLIEWCPDGKQGNFVIAIIGSEPALLNELLALQVRRVGTQQIEIKTFPAIADITKANILFVPDAQFGNVDQISGLVSGTCTLIVSEREGSARRGAGVSLVYNTRIGKIEFEINRGYMREKSLNVNDQLYNLATNIY
jgi:hypothetical protein